MMRSLITPALTVVAACVLVGCGNNDDPAQEIVESQQERIEELERTVNRYASGNKIDERHISEMERRHNREIFELETELKQNRDTYETTIAQLRASIQQHEETIGSLQASVKSRDEQIATLEQEMERLEVSARPAIVDIDDFETEEPVLDDFPLALQDVRGVRTVVGTRTHQRPIETDETYRSEFGDKRPVVDYEDVTVDEYLYQVIFTVSNRTGEIKNLSARAGAVTKELIVMPLQALPNMSVESARGASLRVEVDGRSRTFDVEYTQE